MLSAITYSTFKTEGLTHAEFSIEKSNEILSCIYTYIQHTGLSEGEFLRNLYC
jgi:hypothetical protein